MKDLLKKEKRMFLEALDTHKGWLLIVDDLKEKMEIIQREINTVDPERTIEQENIMKIRRQIYEEMVSKPQDMLSFLVEEDLLSGENDPYDK